MAKDRRDIEEHLPYRYEVSHPPHSMSMDPAPSDSSLVPMIETQLYSLEAELYTHLSEQSFNEATGGARTARYLPIRVYLREAQPDDAARVAKTVQTLCETLRLSVVSDQPPRFDSFWKVFFTKTRHAVTRPEVIERLRKLERAIELEVLDNKQAAVDKEEAEAVKCLLEAVKGTPNAVIQIGSLLVFKIANDDVGGAVFTVTLTQEQMSRISANPRILAEPNYILDYLSKEQSERAASVVPFREVEGRTEQDDVPRLPHSDHRHRASDGNDLLE
jgi:hypothetical protein